MVNKRSYEGGIRMLLDDISKVRSKFESDLKLQKQIDKFETSLKSYCLDYIKLCEARFINDLPNLKWEVNRTWSGEAFRYSFHITYSNFPEFDKNILNDFYRLKRFGYRRSTPFSNVVRWTLIKTNKTTASSIVGIFEKNIKSILCQNLDVVEGVVITVDSYLEDRYGNFIFPSDKEGMLIGLKGSAENMLNLLDKNAEYFIKKAMKEALK